MKVVFEDFGLPYEVGSFIWCLHCEKVFKAENVRLLKSIAFGGFLHLCPNDGCDGKAWDFIPWKKFRSDVTENRFPVVPVEGIRYPLYSSGK